MGTFKVSPEDTLGYFSNVVCPFHPDDESVRSYLLYAFVVFKDHHKEHSCWCFSCQIFNLFSEALVGREGHSLLFMKSDFKISFAHSKSKKRDYLKQN